MFLDFMATRDEEHFVQHVTVQGDFLPGKF